MNNSLELIKTYIENDMTPILIKDELYNDISSRGYTLNADCSLDELNGSYDANGNYNPPAWFNIVNDKRLLIIRNIDSIPVKEQLKFMEILKYKKINEFKLKELIIILTYKGNLLNENILSIATKVD